MMVKRFSSKVIFNLNRIIKRQYWIVGTLFLFGTIIEAGALGYGGSGADSRSFSIGSQSGIMKFEYDMYKLRDSMQVQVSGGGGVDTGFVEGRGVYYFYVPPGESNTITVTVASEEVGSGWQYNIDTNPIGSLLSGLKSMFLNAWDNIWNRPANSLHADPVDTATGAQVISQNLMTLWGGQPLPFTISYHSLLLQNGPFGRGWSHNFQGKLEILDSENVRIRWNNGRYNTFNLGASAKKKGKKSKNQEGYQVDKNKEPSARFYQLVANNDATYTLSDTRNKAQWRFDNQGQLISLKNSMGQSLNLSYNTNQLIRIQEPISGKQLDFTYNPYGKVTELSDPGSGRKVTFSYDSSDLLTNIVLANTNQLNYTYNEIGQILSGADSQGQLFVNTYDEEGRIIAQDDGRAETPLTRFAYLSQRPKKKAIKKLFQANDPASDMETLVSQTPTSDEQQQDLTRGKKKKRKRLEQTTIVLDRNGQLHLYQHNDKLQLLSYIDPEERMTRYRYDKNGNLRMTLYPGHRRVRYRYDQASQMTGLRPPGLNAMKLQYDDQNNLISASAEKKKKENPHQFDYDANNRLTHYQDPLGNNYQLAYDTDGLIQQITKPGGGTSTYSYQQGRPTQIKDSANNLWNLTYDTAGRLTTLSDPEGNTTTYTYDEKDRITSITDALGQTTSYQYDLRGSLTQLTDAQGAITTLTYTPHKKLASITDAQTNTTTFLYDNEDRLISAIDALGNTTQYEYDKIGRRIATIDPLGNRYSHRYDTLGNLIETIDPLKTSQYQLKYNSQQQLSQIKTAQGQKQTYRYDKLGRLIAQNQGNHRKSRYDYDALHRLTQTKTSAKQTTKQRFDTDSNLTSYTDPEEHTTSLGHNQAGQLTFLKTPTGQTTTYTYNNRNLIESVTWPAGQTFTLNYDPAGQLEKLTEEDGDTTYTYDKVGRPLTITKDGQTITRQYDSLGRLTQFTDTQGNTIGYAYDAIGRLTELTYPNGQTVTYTYDANSRLTTVTDWAGRTTRYTYDLIGRLTQTERPNHTQETRTYDKKTNRLTQLTDKSLSATLIDQTYRYNNQGQLTEQNGQPEQPEQDLTQPTEMAYDPDNRLTTYNNINLNYDPNGNLLNGPFGSYTYDSRNRLTQAGSLTYTYDPENQRIAIEDSNGTTQLIHNPNAFLSQLLVRKTPDGKETYYIYGLGLLYQQTDDDQTYYHHYDRQGNTLLLTDQNGQITDQYTYSPYGQTLQHQGTTDNPFRYNGRYGIMTDSNDLLHMRARYYCPQLHRFLNQDILLGSTSDPLSLNRFAYVNGDPVNNVDPLGLFTLMLVVDPTKYADTGEPSELEIRIRGGFQALGGLLEAGAGGVCIAGSEGGGVLLGCGALAANGVDNIQAGFRQAWTGQPVDTVTYQVISNLDPREVAHTALDVISYAKFLPVPQAAAIGWVATGINSAWYYSEGNTTQSVYNLIPFKIPGVKNKFVEFGVDLFFDATEEHNVNFINNAMSETGK
ncbi:MAG: RHS repeat-associated core domain-containing protein [Verrucomicrobiia bacterium]